VRQENEELRAQLAAGGGRIVSPGASANAAATAAANELSRLQWRVEELQAQADAAEELEDANSKLQVQQRDAIRIFECL
jgi:phage shock protein A